jgi:hypothetical protein
MITITIIIAFSTYMRINKNSDTLKVPIEASVMQGCSFFKVLRGGGVRDEGRGEKLLD